MNRRLRAAGRILPAADLGPAWPRSPSRAGTCERWCRVGRPCGGDGSKATVAALGGPRLFPAHGDGGCSASGMDVGMRGAQNAGARGPRRRSCTPRQDCTLTRGTRAPVSGCHKAPRPRLNAPAPGAGRPDACAQAPDPAVRAWHPPSTGPSTWAEHLPSGGWCPPERSVLPGACGTPLPTVARGLVSGDATLRLFITSGARQALVFDPEPVRPGPALRGTRPYAASSLSTTTRSAMRGRIQPSSS